MQHANWNKQHVAPGKLNLYLYLHRVLGKYHLSVKCQYEKVVGKHPHLLVALENSTS